MAGWSLGLRGSEGGYLRAGIGLGCTKCDCAVCDSHLICVAHRSQADINAASTQEFVKSIVEAIVKSSGWSSQLMLGVMLTNFHVLAGTRMRRSILMGAV